MLVAVRHLTGLPTYSVLTGTGKSWWLIPDSVGHHDETPTPSQDKGLRELAHLFIHQCQWTVG